MCDIYNCDYLQHNTFPFNLIDFQSNRDFPSQFGVFYRKITKRYSKIGFSKKCYKRANMWCWRKMLRISWKEHKTNEFVRCQVGEYTPLYHKIVCNKLQYFGHILRREGDCLEKIIVQGMMERQRRRGRQETRWTDGIKESTGLPVTAAYRIAQDRHSWNDIIKRVTTS